MYDEGIYEIYNKCKRGEKYDKKLFHTILLCRSRRLKSAMRRFNVVIDWVKYKA